MTIETGFDSNYRTVLVAARRARQLQGGSKPLTASSSNKACSIALDEIAAGKVPYVRQDKPVVLPPIDAGGIPIVS